MRTLLIDMPAGVAGDMLLGALVGCGADLDRVASGLLGLGLGPIGISARQVRRGALMGWLIAVDAPQEASWSTGLPPRIELSGHARPAQALGPALLAPTGAVRSPSTHAAGPDHHLHRPYAEISRLLERAQLPSRVRERAQRAFRILAEAEGEVHGLPPEQVEFHEVGALDAIADVVGVCLALEQLGIERVVAGPLTPGQGRVRCAHGEMPVPVPAVAVMLVKSRAPTRLLGWETGELTTPTGCALVLALTDAFLGAQAPQALTGTLVASGFGAGTRDPGSYANVLRLSILESSTPSGAGAASIPLSTSASAAAAASALAGGASTPADSVIELRTQVDDATGEQLAALMEEVLGLGALDAFLTPVLMKKGRPGQLLTVLVPREPPERLPALSELLLLRSSTIGVRWSLAERRVLPRRTAEVVVDGQTIPLKIVDLPDGTCRAKPEAEAVARAARALQRGFIDVQAAALQAWRTGAGS